MIDLYLLFYYDVYNSLHIIIRKSHEFRTAGIAAKGLISVHSTLFSYQIRGYLTGT